jgi:hypothetical protein
MSKSPASVPSYKVKLTDALAIDYRALPLSSFGIFKALFF